MTLDRDAWPRIAPFAIYMAFIVVADLLTRLGWSAEQQRWLYAVKVGAVVLALWCWRRRYSELWVAAPGGRALLEAVAVGLLVLVLWLNLDAGWMVIGQSAGFAPTRDGAIYWPLVALRIAGAALVVPVMEELFWRSFLMRWVAGAKFLEVNPARVGLCSFLVTALLFGIEHNLWLAGVTAGIAYGWLYARTGNLWSPVLAHAVTNGALGVWITCTGSWSYW
ncbi:CAAX prenyl protease-related protein [Duganella sp. BuS-21]|uniref:CAAX prenyl protease-related protein n=1 Tax=Duganella sp. BuS-21 TaxID=2943848 RepID=UPI0035A64D5E